MDDNWYRMTALRLPQVWLTRQFGKPERRLGECMASAKETRSEIIARQPVNSSYDEILRELAFARMVQRGLEDSDAGRTPSDEGIKEKLDSWRI